MGCTGAHQPGPAVGAVRVWAEGVAEPSAWSETVVVEAGLLKSADWSAELVQPLLPEPGTAGEPAALLRREFVIERPIVRAPAVCHCPGCVRG